MTQAAVAAGHPETAAAAAVILEDGGSAVDAAIAAMQAACVAEPVLASLGGGGFGLVVPPAGAPRAYDFFPANPRFPRPPSELDFCDIEADFGATTQTFHIGQGTAAVPGLVRGMARLADDFGRMTPMQRAAPGIRTCEIGRDHERGAGLDRPDRRTDPAGERGRAGPILPRRRSPTVDRRRGSLLLAVLGRCVGCPGP